MKNNPFTDRSVNQITTCSKYLALGLFMVLPFVGGYIGYQFGLEQIQTATTPGGLVPEVVLPEQNMSVDVSFEETTDFYTITTVYPREARDTAGVMAEYVKGLVSAKQTEWKMGGETQLAEAAVSAEFPDRSPVTYVLDVRYASSTSMKLGTITYVFLVSEVTGGANGNAVITTFTFTADGQVAIESILDFANNNDIALSKLMAEVAVIQNPKAFQDTDQLKEGLGIAYLKSDGVTLDTIACGCDGFFFGSNFQNFTVTDTGLTFTFSKYTLAPGAVMTPDISLTWAQLAPYLQPDFARSLSLD